MPTKPAPTRAELLADLATAYVLEQVHDDEITISMLLDKGVCTNDKMAGKILRKAVRDGKLEPPVKRASVNGRLVLAWKMKGKPTQAA